MRNLNKIQILIIALFISTFTFAQTPAGYTSVGSNLSFEFPVMGCNSPSYIIIDDNYLPGWRSTSQGGSGRTCSNEDNIAYTTDGQNNVEMWSSGYNSVPAAEGNQFMELNAHHGGAFFQDFILEGDCYDVYWSVQHRGRSGVDSMRIEISSGETVYVSRIVGTDRNGWQQYQGVFSTTDITTSINMTFTTVSTHNNNISVGNFIDDVQFAVSSMGCAALLPVEMVSFTAENEAAAVVLDWLTASEEDNAGFNIERSKDGQIWETIDHVKGNGTTTDYSAYTYNRQQPTQQKQATTD